jgi:hypothetical protein
VQHVGRAFGQRALSVSKNSPLIATRPSFASASATCSAVSSPSALARLSVSKLEAVWAEAAPQTSDAATIVANPIMRFICVFSLE